MAKEKLLSITKKDFRMDTFRAGGKGGQHQNKTNSGVRLTHLESGAVGEARDHKEQFRNRAAAFDRCINTDKFKMWLKKKTAEAMMTKRELEEREYFIAGKVAKAMAPENIRAEIKNDKGEWVEWQPRLES